MAVGPISSPATWAFGTVVPPTWSQAVQDDINGLGFTQVARAYRILATCGSPYTSAGAIGGWTMGTGNFVMTAAGGGNYLIIPVELPYATGGSGTGGTLTQVNVRVKPAGASGVVAKVWDLDTQNSTGGSPALNALSAAISSSGTGEQILAVPLTSPLVIDATKVCLIEVLSGQASDLIYSAEVQYTIAGY